MKQETSLPPFNFITDLQVFCFCACANIKSITVYQKIYLNTKKTNEYPIETNIHLSPNAYVDEDLLKLSC